MTTFQRSVRVALAALTVALTMVAPVRAQAPAFGVVDVQRCVEESKVNIASAQQFQGMQTALNQVLDRLQRGGGAFLAAAEIKELAGLYEKAQATDAEKKRILELEGKADQKSGALKRLETTPNLNDEQKKQLEDLTGAQQAGIQSLQELQQEFQKRLQEKNRELSRKVEAEIRVAIAKVAKDKGLTLVFSTETVLYAAVDITEDVLKAVK